jgi:hypothetical protein
MPKGTGFPSNPLHPKKLLMQELLHHILVAMNPTQVRTPHKPMLEQQMRILISPTSFNQNLQVVMGVTIMGYPWLGLSLPTTYIARRPSKSPDRTIGAANMGYPWLASPVPTINALRLHHKNLPAFKSRAINMKFPLMTLTQPISINVSRHNTHIPERKREVANMGYPWMAPRRRTLSI